MRNDIYRKIDSYVLPKRLEELLDSSSCRKKLAKCTLGKFPRDIKSFGYKAVLLTIHIEDIIHRIHIAKTRTQKLSLKLSLLQYCHWRIVCVQYLANSDTERAIDVAKTLKINFKSY